MLRGLQPGVLVLLLAGLALGVLLSHALPWTGLTSGGACAPPQTLLWPVAAVLIAALLAQAIVTVARLGIRVEIFTRTPIGISTQRAPIQAQVTRVRL